MSDRRWFSLAEIAARRVPAIFEDHDGSRWEIIANEKGGVFVGRRVSSWKQLFIGREPRRGAHLRADGTPCPYLHNGVYCNKCGFFAPKESVV